MRILVVLAGKAESNLILSCQVFCYPEIKQVGEKKVGHFTEELQGRAIKQYQLKCVKNVNSVE